MRRCLIFDADDTLWENNIYFERAAAEFLTLMRPVAPDAAAVVAALRQVEIELIPIGGYGTRNFVCALKETCCRVYRGSNAAAYLEAIERIGDRLLHHPLELRPGVLSTLPRLSQEHRLLLFSKGDLREQSGKLERSGLRRYFDRVVIAPEKDESAYSLLLHEHALSAEATFMIGNSPRSDVLPALAAGLWAIFLPHPHTWAHEEHPVEDHPRLLRARAFDHLPSLMKTQGAGTASAI
jgi:putative hydrolase of the HAD superfamily